MKILYAIQATGNGHISRAIQLYPYLKNYGEIDFFLSGESSSLKPSIPIKYRSKGMSLYFKECGDLDYYKTLREYSPLRLKREIRDLPVEKYDVIINDFDYITARACKSKGINSIHFGHQASFLSEKTPRPTHRSIIGETILKKYAPSTINYGLHFQKYDDFIFDPIIKKEVLSATPTNKGHITVYLPTYKSHCLKELFFQFPMQEFHLFSWNTKDIHRTANINHFPIDKDLFALSLKDCTGLITGGGFESPAEALYLGKKLLSIPVARHYEQQCNSAALAKLGVMTKNQLSFNVIDKWLNYNQPEIEIKANNIRTTLDLLLSNKLESGIHKSTKPNTYSAVFQ